MKFHVFSISSLDGSSSLLQSEHKNPQATFQNNNNSSSSNSTNNTTSNFSYGLYQEIIVYSNIPFFAIFCGMLVVSVASFAIQYKTVRRNQKILFGLLFALLCFVIVNMLTRIGSELTVLIPDLDTAIKTNQYVKAVDRVVVILVLYVEMLILSHICKILLDTTKAINKISLIVYKRYQRFLITLLVIIAAVFTLVTVFVFIFAGISSSNIVHDTTTLNYILLALLVCGGLTFLFAAIMITILLNIIGKILLSSMNSELKTDVTQGSHLIKKNALSRAISLQIGLSISLLCQAFGFVCIPLTILWKYNMIIFHHVYNIALCIFIVFILSIFNPLKQIQQKFKPENGSNQRRRTTFDKMMERASVVSDSSVDYYYEYNDEDFVDEDDHTLDKEHYESSFYNISTTQRSKIHQPISTTTTTRFGSSLSLRIDNTR
ncbi:hypothetical protein FDP41_007148 [Naegleria fowleri]|uniref:G-protein coupled receptors family 1 profile domain-containing protein n=1 Tax=Naegleria fowleri TaxID=5763 RepID=A0A6A5BH34_NAEFO|nr:uncharacterized protein FDP41_007148 [Naegleria fowleri]KAF0973761.1 hypothetical protein FDP41_007148 [Naegleria fowleri]